MWLLWLLLMLLLLLFWLWAWLLFFPMWYDWITNTLAHDSSVLRV